MSDCLWNDIDAWLVSNLVTQMGSGSAYETLKLATIQDEILTDPQSWSNVDMPVVFVEGRTGRPVEAEHGGIGTPNQTIRYRYVLLSVVKGEDKSTAKIDAKTMDYRLRQFLLLATNSLRGLANTTGNERVNRIEFGENQVNSFPIARAVNANYYGTATYAIDVFVRSN